MWLSLVERCVRDAKAAGSNPVIPTKKYGSLAQLGERLPYKQRVGGSSPSTSTINKQPTALLEWQRFFNIETSISK